MLKEPLGINGLISQICQCIKRGYNRWGLVNSVRGRDIFYRMLVIKKSKHFVIFFLNFIVNKISILICIYVLEYSNHFERFNDNEWSGKIFIM